MNDILLREENNLLNSLIGKSFNEKTKLEANKILSEIHSKAFDRSLNKMSICYALDNNEIKSIGGSTLIKKDGQIVKNLILDQFGEFLSGIFKGQNIGNYAVNIKDDGGNAESVLIYGGSTFNNIGSSLGSQLRLGSGSTPPTRQDFNIETPLVTAPESNLFNIGTAPVWNSGLGNFKVSGSISAGGSGTINESIIEMLWDNSASLRQGFIIFRDIISPSVDFVAGQTLALEYTIQL